MNKFIVTTGIIIALCALLKITLPIKNSEETIKTYWTVKTHSPKKYDIVVCGDSRIYRSISSKSLTDELDLSLEAINLGYSGCGFSKEYIDFALSRFAPSSKHKVLVLGITPHSLTKEAFKNEHYHSFKEMKESEIYKTIYASPLLSFFQPYKPSDIFDRKEKNYQQQYVNTSWISSHYIKPDTTYAIKRYRKTFSKYQVENEEAILFLNNIKDITKNGINIIAFRPPSTVSMRNLEDSISNFNEQKIKDELISNGVIWMDFTDQDYVSYDGSHLHFDSGKKLSREIGNKINRILKPE